MHGMFRYASSLTNHNLSSFDTSNVTNMYFMFFGARNLSNITFSPNFTTPNVTHMNAMFSRADSLTSPNLSGFDTRNVTHMANMFLGASSLATVELSPSFSTGNVTTMRDMFRSASGKTRKNLLKDILIIHIFETIKPCSFRKRFFICKCYWL